MVASRICFLLSSCDSAPQDTTVAYLGEGERVALICPRNFNLEPPLTRSQGLSRRSTRRSLTFQVAGISRRPLLPRLRFRNLLPVGTYVGNVRDIPVNFSSARPHPYPAISPLRFDALTFDGICRRRNCRARAELMSNRRRGIIDNYKQDKISLFTFLFFFFFVFFF